MEVVDGGKEEEEKMGLFTSVIVGGSGGVDGVEATAGEEWGP